MFSKLFPAALAFILGPMLFGQVTDGLVAYYQLDGNAIDASAYSNNGVVNGAIAVEDRFGSSNAALDFDGTLTDYVTIEETPSLQLEQISFSAWILLEAPGEYNIINKSHYDDATFEQFSLSFLDSVFEFAIKRESSCLPGIGWQRVKSRVITEYGSWVFVVGTWDGITEKIYFNGQIDSTNNNVPNGPIDQCLGSQIRIGRNWASDEMHLLGSLDDVRIHNRALSAVEIDTLYHLDGWDPNGESMTDIDGNVYETVQIGDQTWMAENLRVTHYRNGDTIPKVTDSTAWANLTSSGFCNYDNNDANADVYGSLYNGYAVNDNRNIAPPGWHIPSDDEWKELEMAQGMSQADADAESWRGTNEGSKLAGNADLWTTGSLENDAEFGNSGFNALPSGYRHYDPGNSSGYFSLGDFAYFRNATEVENNFTGYRLLHYGLSSIQRSFLNPNYGFSVRCVKNDPDFVEIPQNLIATPIGNAIILDWDGTGEIDLVKYRIYRGIETTAYTLIDSVTTGSPITSTYTDNNVTNGTTYYYSIKAVDADGNTSAYSNEDSATLYETLTDIDGNVYETVQIGDQTWMAENLRVTHYRDGTAITTVPNAATWAALGTEAYCFYNNNTSNEADTYGALYNWFSVADSRNVAPAGWHVPTDDEWKELEMTLGMSQSEANNTGYRGVNEGSKLAGNTGLWDNGELESDTEFGSSGLNALPGGARSSANGEYYGLGGNVSFWTATETTGDEKWYRTLYFNRSDIWRYSVGNGNDGFAIRCVKDSVTGYSGPTWHISTDGSDSTGNGSIESPFGTIQNGIDAAQDGDTVLVNPGNYFENLNITEKSITLGSLSLVTGDSSYTWQTTIQGGGSTSGSVISIVGSTSQSNSSLIHGFNIVNGGSSWFDGGISCQAEAIIERNLIHSNHRNGITVIGEYNPTIRFNAIHNNSSHGIHLDTSVDTSTHIYLNRIFENAFDGIYCQTFASPIISDNVVSENGRHGFNIITQSNPIISNNIIWGNIASSFAFSDPPNAPILSYNCIEGGFPESGIDNGNNISGDPLFCDLEWGNFSVDDDSPLIGIGPQGTNIGSAQIGCDLYYLGPVWHISTNGSDSTGNGSIESPFGTIQNGIDSSENGDTVLVQPGTYLESINFAGKNIVVGSLLLTTGDTTYLQQTVINAGEAPRAVEFSSGEDLTAALIGFTILNGSTQGIFFENSSPTINNCIISQTLTHERRGIWCYTASPRIDNVLVTNNNGIGIWIGYEAHPVITNSTSSYNDGAGIYCTQYSNPTLTNVISEGNSDPAAGGGFFASAWCNPILKRVIIRDNQAGYNGGGGIYVGHNSSVILDSSLVSGNSSTDGGGAIRVVDGSVITCTRSEISNNSSIYGGGSYFGEDGSTASFENCTFFGGGIYLQGHYLNTTTVNYNNSIIWESPLTLEQYTSVGVLYSVLQSGTDAIIGDISSSTFTSIIDEDPQFLNSGSGDFSLTANSPCIDSGDPSSPFDPDGTMADMGAYYYHQIPTYSGPVWHVSVDGSDVTGDGSNASPYASIQFGINSAIDGDTVLVEPGEYVENLSINHGGIHLASTFLITQDTTQISNTVINGDASGSVIILDETGTSSVKITGFVVKNGWNSEGAGIHVINNSIAYLDHMRIIGNQSSSAGAGLVASNNSICILDSCKIIDNHATTDGAGIWINSNSFASISYSLIANNSAWGNGGAFKIQDQSSLRLTNVTIGPNEAQGYGNGSETPYFGCAFYLDQADDIEISNSILDNYTDPIFFVGGSSDTINVSYSNFTGEEVIIDADTDQTYELILGEGNINLEAQFTNWETGDYTLQQTSPCIDAGDPDADGDGTTWVTDTDDQDPDGTRMDMGAFYYHQELTYNGPIWHVSTEGSDETGDGSEEAPFASIQFGINSSQNGDTVLVQPGTYVENINFNGKNIVVGSLSLTTGDTSFINQTIIDGNQAGSVVTFNSGEDSTALLMGITIRNGLAENGGGMSVENSSPSITNCIIYGNQANLYGGGMWVANSNISILRSQFQENSALGSGGGVFADQDAFVTFDSCDISENDAPGMGGGIFCWLNADLRIIECNIGRNTSARGGGLYCTAATPFILKTTFHDNIASDYGGGLVFHGTEGVASALTNLTIYNNQATNYGGGIISTDHTGILDVSNTILWSNTPDQISVTEGSVTVEYSDVQNGWTGVGNIDLNPLMVDPGNYDYRLNYNSPCIDTGDPISQLDPDSTRADMGAFYFHQYPAYSGSVWHVSTEGSDEVGDGSISNPFSTVQRAEGSASENDTIQLGDGVFEDSFLIQNKSLVIRGIDSTVTVIAADYVYCQTNGESHSVRFQNLRFESIVTGSHTMIWSECTNCTESDSITVEFVNVYGDGSAEKSFMAASTRSVVEVYNSQFKSFSRGNYGGVFDLERANSNSSLSIFNSVFLDNVADRGGAIHLENGNSLYINQSEFTNNYATRTDQGGGAIFLSSDCRADISSTRFLNNSTGGSGGAINSAESDIQLNLCSFNQNSAAGQGQALHVYGSGRCVLTRSTIGANGSIPGSVSLQTGVNFEVDNSILWGNPNFQIVVLNSAIACTVAVEYTDLSNGILGIDDQSGSLVLNWSDGNINAFPEFNSTDDLTLQVSSPCIDAGDPDYDGDGDTWDIDPDDQDPDGTRFDIGAFYFNQTDTVAPQVQLNYPEITSEPQNGDTLLVTWIASDNIQLSWAKLWFSPDGGQSFTLSDSIDANWEQAEWVVPNVISNSCKLAIWVSDMAGNVGADTLESTFPVDDGTPPTISILTPTISSTVPERDSLFVTWEAADNVGIEWFDLFYYNKPGGFETSSFNIPASDRSFSFEVPTPGVSDSAQIKIEVWDLAGLSSYDYSDYFSVTDNTRPYISHFSIPDTLNWGIGSVMDISVVASDNVEITSLDLNYSTDNGSNWLPIVGDLYPVQGRPTYSWLIPDIPGECQIRAVVSDAVGLTDTSYSEVFTIYVEYPRLIASLPEIRPDGSIHVRFSQLMDSLNIAEGTQVLGSVHGIYEIEGELNGYDAVISASDGFVSLDTLALVLLSSEWTNRYGYGLDGNENGVYDGGSLDNDTSFTIVSAAGDYNRDGVLNFDDFDDFVIAWNNKVTDYELAPHQGEIPFINIQPDSSFDIYDLATFASMWNWAVGVSLSAPLTHSYQYDEFISEQTGNELEVSLPINEYVASQTIIKYDPGVVQVSVEDGGLSKVSSSGLSMVDVNPDSGFILITSSHLTDSYDEDLKLKLVPDTKQRYSIEIAFQGSDMEANVVQKRTLVELLPIPTSFSLSQNYPNPFNANTTIEYGLPKDSDLSISIYDIRGRFVKDIYSGEQQAGYHLTHWDASDESGRNVSSGLYFIVLNTPEYRVAKKALILK